MTEKMKKAVKSYLEDNTEEALDLARQMNSVDCSFEWTDACDFDELCELAAEEGGEAVYNLCSACVAGETYGGMVRYDAYGNLEPAEEEDLLQDASNYMDDILNGLENYIDDDGCVDSCIDISLDLEEIIVDIAKQEADEEFDIDEDI